MNNHPVYKTCPVCTKEYLIASADTQNTSQEDQKISVDFSKDLAHKICNKCVEKQSKKS